MSTHIRMTEEAWKALTTHHRNKGGMERASVALGSTVRHGGRRVVLFDMPGVALLNRAEYSHQHGGAVAVKPDVTRRLMWWLAQSNYDAFLSCHDHWFSRSGTRFSSGDDADDLKQDRYFRDVLLPTLRANPEYGNWRDLTHLSMVLDATTFDARCIDTTQALRLDPIGPLSIIGPRMVRLAPNARPPEAIGDEDTQLRHRDFLDPVVLGMLRHLRVAIVGCGGMGPLVAENLLRLGVREFVLFDPDRVDRSNLNRWPGARPYDVGRLKVDVLADHLRAAAPQAVIETIAVDVVDANPFHALASCDLAVGAVDNDVARFWLNRACCAGLVPLFDFGVRVRVKPRTDFLTRFVPVIPGTTACLECTALRLLDRTAIAKRLDGLSHNASSAAGYVADMVAGAPSVMGLNMMAAGAGTLEILSYVSGWEPVPRIKTTTWSTGRSTAVDRESHLPAVNCEACASGHRARACANAMPGVHRDADALAKLRGLFG